VAWWRWAVRIGIPSVLAATAYVLQVQLGEQLPQWLHWTLLGVGGVSTLAALLIPGRAASQEYRRREEAEQITRDVQSAIADYRIKINDGLRPFVGLLDRIINAASLNEQRLRQGSMIQATMNFASVRLGGGQRTRACYFKYHPGPPRRLVYNGQYTGRDDQPRRQFTEGEAPGDYIFEILTARRTVLHPDETASNEPPMRTDAQYKTFITSTVASGDTLFGMLSVDSTDVGDLTTQDKIFVAIVAQILGSALAVARRTQNPSKPAADGRPDPPVPPPQ
jgi:hypothetical protein